MSMGYLFQKRIFVWNGQKKSIQNDFEYFRNNIPLLGLEGPGISSPDSGGKAEGTNREYLQEYFAEIDLLKSKTLQDL